MKKLMIIFSVICIVMLVGCSSDSVSNDEIDKRKNSDGISVDNNIIESHLKKISSVIRNYGSKGEVETSEYIKSVMNEYGYDVEFQNFEVYEQDLNSTIYADDNMKYLMNNPYDSKSLGVGRNVIATSKNNFDNDKKTLYITAHYDTADNTVGVIDNASGTATVLELGRVLKDIDNDFNIVMVFFSAEEYFRSGSRYFVSNLSEEEKNNVIGCINVDMIGEKGIGSISMNSATGKNNLISVIIDELTDNEFNLLKGGGSDELSFYMGKIPAISFWNDYREGSGSEEGVEEDLNSIDINIIKTFCETMYKAINNIDIEQVNKILKDKKIRVDNKMEDEINEVEGFEVRKKSEELLENGYDVETELIYKNESTEFTVKEKSSRFIVKEELDKFIYFDSSSDEGYYIVDDNGQSKIIYKLGFDYGEINGGKDKKEMIEFFNEYCKNYGEYQIED